MQFWGVKKWCSKHACWKFLKSGRLLVVLREHIIFHVKWFDVRKISEVFWAKLYCKTWSFLQVFVGFELSTRKSEIKKKLCMPEIIFSKKEFQIWDFWIIYILVQISIFLGTALGYFSSSVNLGYRHFGSATPPLHHHHHHNEKASYGPVYRFQGF